MLKKQESNLLHIRFLDDDILAKIGKRHHSWKPLAKEIEPDLYQSKNGLLVNATSDGTANILKYQQL